MKTKSAPCGLRATLMGGDDEQPSARQELLTRDFNKPDGRPVVKNLTLHACAGDEWR